MWKNPYINSYVKSTGTKSMCIYDFEDRTKDKIAYISKKPSTRAAFDLALRESALDCIAFTDSNIKEDTMEQLRPSRYVEMDGDTFIIQSSNIVDLNMYGRNINMVRCNGIASFERNGEMLPKYANILCYFDDTMRGAKQFSSGVKEDTIFTMQIPTINVIKGFIYKPQIGDIVHLTYIIPNIDTQYKVEGIGNAVSGVLEMQLSVNIG